MFGDTGNGSRSFSAYNAKHLINMKQTVSIPATDINVVSKSSVLTMWLNRENQLLSSVLEESVSNCQVCFMAHASLAFMALVGSAFKKLIQKVCGLKIIPIFAVLFLLVRRTVPPT